DRGEWKAGKAISAARSSPAGRSEEVWEAATMTSRVSLSPNFPKYSARAMTAPVSALPLRERKERVRVARSKAMVNRDESLSATDRGTEPRKGSIASDSAMLVAREAASGLNVSGRDKTGKAICVASDGSLSMPSRLTARME